jgi:hypothetical protein
MSSSRQRRQRNILLSLSAAFAVVSGAFLVAPAGAVPQADTPVSGDPRATAYAGNATDCADAGLPGEVIDVEFTIDATNTYVTITSVPDGYVLTGVVVKGGPAYNVYVGDVRTDLHAPLVSSGKPAQISHWFACGTAASPTSPPSSPTTPPSSPTTPPSSPTTPPSSPTTPPPTVSPAPTTPGIAPIAPPPAGGALPVTGSNVLPITGLGLALVLGGIAVLLEPRMRRRLQRR